MYEHRVYLPCRVIHRTHFQHRAHAMAMNGLTSIVLNIPSYPEPNCLMEQPIQNDCIPCSAHNQALFLFGYYAVPGVSIYYPESWYIGSPLPWIGKIYTIISSNGDFNLVSPVYGLLTAYSAITFSEAPCSKHNSQSRTMSSQPFPESELVSIYP